MADNSNSERRPESAQDEPAAADVDFRGVDRAQIRRMLAMSPVERLEWLASVVDDIVQIRRLNEKRAVR